MRFVAISLLFLMSCCLGCASQRRPIPVGEIPQAREVAAVDEQYGQEVLQGLTEKYPLDRDDQRILRARDVVDRLADAANASQQPWHVYVLVDDSFKNAAATRGNYIFIWTGLMKSIQTDGELATVLAHEMGHVLAGHTEPTPNEEVNRIVTGVTGSVVSSVLTQAGYAPIAGDLAEALVSTLLEAIVVNPEQQRVELEADHIGLFLLADAGYPPADAIRFWERALHDGDMGGPDLGILSTHPATKQRLEQLRRYLPEAEQRYADAKAGHTRRSSVLRSAPPASNLAPNDSWRVSDSARVSELTASVHRSPDRQSARVAELPYGKSVVIAEDAGRWVRISAPVAGYMLRRDLEGLP